MGKILWNTDINAPCCHGEIVNLENENESILIQTDWDFPSVAQSFGWSIREVQKNNKNCDHSSTDGTIDCDCGITVNEFIEAARIYLSNDGMVTEDPGYFI